jgi:hypothetical protein
VTQEAKSKNPDRERRGTMWKDMNIDKPPPIAIEEKDGQEESEEYNIYASKNQNSTVESEKTSVIEITDKTKVLGKIEGVESEKPGYNEQHYGEIEHLDIIEEKTDDQS